MMTIHIDRCYCKQKTFAYLIATARQETLTLPELAQREGVGTQCGWCVAYLRRGLQTGETAFHYLMPKEPIEQSEPEQSSV